MGHFYSRCTASSMPIFYEDAIVAVPIIDNASSFHDTHLGTGFSYPTGMCAPYMLPIFGEYNDYGGIEEITQQWWHTVMLNELNGSMSEKRGMFRQLVVVDDRGSKIPVDCNGVGTLDLQSFADFATSRGLRIDKYRVGLALIRRDIYDAFIAVAERYENLSLEQLDQDADLYLQYVQEFSALDKGTFASIEEFRKVFNEYFTGTDTWGRHSARLRSSVQGKGNVFTEWASYEPLFGRHISEVHRYLCAHATSLSQESWQAFKKHFIDFVKFSIVFEEAGRFWFPQPTEGQLRQVHPMFLAAHKAVGVVARKVAKDIKRRD